MILVVCPNPALDRTLTVSRLASGAVHRSDGAIEAAGGKGFNVARALKALGREALVVAPLGGWTGRYLEELADREGLKVAPVEIAGLTRTCTILNDGREDTVVYEPGPVVSDDEWHKLVKAVGSAGLNVDADLVVVSGSFPGGLGSGAVGALRAAVQDPPLWVDTSGEALRELAAAQVAGIKVNRTEWAELGMDRPPGTTLVVTDGARGARLEAEGIRLEAVGPPVELVSAVGSGDAFLAGWLSRLSAGPEEALRWAVACGADNARRLGGGRIDPASVAQLAGQVRILA